MSRYCVLSLSLALVAITALADFRPEFPREGDCVGNANCMDIDIPDEDLSIQHIFAPKGFDNKDNVEVLAFVQTPSTCYREPTALYSRNGHQIFVSVHAARKPGKKFCVPMLVPHLVRLPLNQDDVSVGELTFFDAASRDTQLARMTIGQPSTSDIDDHVYAAAESVSFDDATRTVILTGRNPSDCIELDRIETIWNGVDTIAILPIMKRVKEACESKMVPFSYSHVVSATSQNPIELLHVRALGGHALNYLVHR